MPGLLIAADGGIGSAGTRCSQVFVVVAVALVDFDDRFDFRIVVPPIRAHPRGRARVRSAHAAEVLQVGVEQLGIGGARVDGAALHVAARQRPNAALWQDYVAMAVWEDHTPFISKR